jgi:uracil permease
VAEARWIGLPIQGTNTVFSLFKSCDGGRLVSAIAIMMPIALATMVEHIGDVCAISSTVGENYVADPGLHRTLLGDGAATTLAALFGAPANTTYGENTGVLALTKVYDPKVIRIAALLAVLFAFCPKFEALIHAMPAATIGGVSLILYGMISAVGVRNVVENQVDFTKSRNIIVAALIMGLTLGIHFSGSQGADTVNAINGAISFSVGAVTIKLSGLAVGALVGILLNAVLPGNDYVFGENQLGDTSVNFQQGIDRTGTKKR